MMTSYMGRKKFPANACRRPQDSPSFAKQHSFSVLGVVQNEKMRMNRCLYLTIAAAFWTVYEVSGAARICSEPCVLEYEIPCQSVIDDYQLYGSCCSLTDVNDNDIARRNILCRLTVAGNDTHCTFGEAFLQCGIDLVGCQPTKTVLKGQTVESCPASMYDVPLEAPPPTIAPSTSLQPSMHQQDMKDMLPTIRPTTRRSGKKGGSSSSSVKTASSTGDASFANNQRSTLVAAFSILSLLLL